MNIKELCQALVECEDKMERMGLVEANKDCLEVVEQPEVDPNKKDFESMYNELTKKYIDTFFGGTEKDPDVDGQKDTKDEETKKAENITIDDVLKGGK